MDSLWDDSLHTTLSSIDFGTSLEETVYFTSTPIKPTVPRVEDVFPLCSPPLSGTMAVLSRKALEGIAASLGQNFHKSDQELQTMRFKRQRLELRLDHLQERSTVLKNRDEKIRRRHTELCRKRSNIANSSASSTNDTDSDHMTDVKRVRLRSHTMSVSPSQRQLNNFRRYSVRRRASRKRNRPFQKCGPENPAILQPDDDTDLAEASQVQTDRYSLIKKPVQKMRKTQSLRRFVLKKFNIRLKF